MLVQVRLYWRTILAIATSPIACTKTKCCTGTQVIVIQLTNTTSLFVLSNCYSTSWWCFCIVYRITISELSFIF
ncbi:hypothetical protein BDF19DRAFT_440102 [Syncephalis fuscata]|nr:hypothetical protein BDF19DRAFT_440102 [Syncephalis fuscata]